MLDSALAMPYIPAMTYHDVIKFFGSQASAGRALGITRQSVFSWKLKGIDPMRQCHIELHTGGKLKADRHPKKNS